jgi:hypothetical protein
VSAVAAADSITGVSALVTVFFGLLIVDSRHAAFGYRNSTTNAPVGGWQCEFERGGRRNFWLDEKKSSYGLEHHC